MCKFLLDLFHIKIYRTFSDILLVMGTSLDPIAFPTIADKPRRQQYYIKMRTVKP